MPRIKSLALPDSDLPHCNVEAFERGIACARCIRSQTRIERGFASATPALSPSTSSTGKRSRPTFEISGSSPRTPSKVPKVSIHSYSSTPTPVFMPTHIEDERRVSLAVGERWWRDGDYSIAEPPTSETMVDFEWEAMRWVPELEATMSDAYY